jgi:hypothetical protein
MMAETYTQPQRRDWGLWAVSEPKSGAITGERL